jgi:two-component system, NarL family, nitrate/nitrite response regulator NarL
MNAPILRVLVVDDSEVIRRGICKVLHLEPDIEVVCEAVDGVDGVRKAKEHKPDFVLMDVTMPGMNGLEAARLINQESPSIRIVMVSQHNFPAYRREALASGASGYVVKADAFQELIPELRRIQSDTSARRLRDSE